MFADLITERIKKTGSVVVAGFDPRIENLPSFILESAKKATEKTEDRIFKALIDFHMAALESLKDKIAAIKPNAAFFEQLGLGGLRALKEICLAAESMRVPLIMDAKRGDIGSTAEAYSKAFLGDCTAFGDTISAFPSSALTVNPFLGFDTLEPFIQECRQKGKGIFVLVKTSNPGSADIQGSASQDAICRKIANWIAQNAGSLSGKSGLSGLGAVVGATYPEEAKLLRQLMPTSLFLVPGYGAQGARAQDVMPNFNPDGSGALINVSRGLLGNFDSKITNIQNFKVEIHERIAKINLDLSSALSEQRK